MNGDQTSLPIRHGLIGRDVEFGRVTDFLSGAAAPGSTMSNTLIVEGDPGVGKTALARAVAVSEAARGSTLLWAEGVQSEVSISYACLTPLLAPVLDAVHRLPEGHRGSLHAALGLGEPGEGRFPRVAEALCVLFTRLSETAPVIVIVDDLQWVDSASADALGRAARSLTDSRVRFLVLKRIGVHTLFDLSGLPQLQLEPLSESDAAALLAARFPEVKGPVIERVLTESAGNPLALLELPSALAVRQRTAESPLPTHMPLTQRLQDVFGARVRQLPPETRQRLLVLALAESGLPSDAGLEWLDPLLPAERAGLVELGQPPGQVTFRHPLVRTTILEQSTAVDRRDAHLALASHYVVADERHAWHLAAAAVTPQESVARLLEAAATRTLHRGDAAGTVRTLVRAAELSPEASERARRLAKAAYVGADLGGDLRNAARLLEDADRADPSGARTLTAAMATAYLQLNGAGDTITAHRVLVAALQHVDTATADPDTVAEAVQTLCEICLYAAKPELWSAYHDAAATVDLSAYPTLALWDEFLVDPARRAHAHIADLERALASLEHEGDPVRIERVATAAVFADRIHCARDSLMRLVRNARKGISVGSGIVGLMLLSLESFKRGEWALTRQLTDEGVSMATTQGLDLLVWPMRLPQGLLAASTGSDAELGVLIDQMHNWATPRQAGTVIDYAHYAAGLDGLARGDYEKAFHELSKISPPGELSDHNGWALTSAMDLVQAAVHSGRFDAAASHVRALHAHRVEALSSRLALLVAGSAAMAAIPFDRDLYEAAVSIEDADQWPFDLARIRLCYGQTLRREREAAAARPHLQAALEIFERLGAHPWVERAQRELQATSQAKRGPSAPLGTASLTPQEQHVALLAAQGLTNQQIGERLLISPRTVGSHLASVYRKLDVTGRGGLHLALTDAAVTMRGGSNYDETE